MYSRKEIICKYKPINLDINLFDKSVTNIKDLILNENSLGPIIKDESELNCLSKCYVLPYRILQQKRSAEHNTNNDDFFRPEQFNKEPVIICKIENLEKIYEKYKISKANNLFYIKGKYDSISGPFNYEQINLNYKSNRIDSNTEFRLIDIFQFKDSNLFSFKSLKIINEDNWTDNVIESSLLQYIKKEENINDIKNNEIKEKDIKKPEIKKNDISEKDIKKAEIKKDVIKNEEIKKEETNNKEKIIEKIESMEKEEIKEENEKKNNNKKGKKKKKQQFVEADIEVGFKISNINQSK